jgi:hypothetical protein
LPISLFFLSNFWRLQQIMTTRIVIIILPIYQLWNDKQQQQRREMHQKTSRGERKFGLQKWIIFKVMMKHFFHLYVYRTAPTLYQNHKQISSSFFFLASLKWVIWNMTSSIEIWFWPLFRTLSRTTIICI